MTTGVDRTVERYAPFPPFIAWLIEPFDLTVAEGFQRLLQHAPVHATVEGSQDSAAEDGNGEA